MIGVLPRILSPLTRISPKIRMAFVSRLFYYDKHNGAVRSGIIRGRYIIAPHSMLYILTDEYKRAAGKGASPLLYRMGFECGSRLGTAIAKQYRLRNVKEWGEIMQYISYMSGWSSATEYDADIDTMRGTLILHDYVLSRYAEGSGDSYCDWARGWLAGSYSAVFKIEGACIERKCKAYGDPYCEWDIGKKEDVLFAETPG